MGTNNNTFVVASKDTAQLEELKNYLNELNVRYFPDKDIKWLFLSRDHCITSIPGYSVMVGTCVMGCGVDLGHWLRTDGREDLISDTIYLEWTYGGPYVCQLSTDTSRPDNLLHSLYTVLRAYHPKEEALVPNFPDDLRILVRRLIATTEPMHYDTHPYVIRNNRKCRKEVCYGN